VIEVRQLAVEDLETVISGITSLDPDQHRRILEEQDRSPGFTQLIAWLDGEAVGYVGMALSDDRSLDEMVESRGFALVTYLHVEGLHRRKGVGRALMEALEERARSEGAPGVILDTGTGDDFVAARALYHSLGYVDQGGVYLGGWSDPDHPGVHVVDSLTGWRKPFSRVIRASALRAACTTSSGPNNSVK
jgi:GNAT superfamily N-acetyltransferase